MKLVIILCSMLFFACFVSGDFGYNDADGPIFTPPINYSELPTVNSSKYWYTTSLGALDDANSTQMESNSETLSIKESWVTGLFTGVYCLITGCTMEGDIDMGDNDIINVNHINTTTINGTIGYFTDMYVSNSTLYIGNIKISEDEGLLNISENVTAPYFAGDGSQLTNLNISYLNGTVLIDGDLNITGDTYGDLFVGGIFNGSSITQDPLDNSTYIATTAYVDLATIASQYWNRISNYLTPSNSGDSLLIGGNLTANDTLFLGDDLEHSLSIGSEKFNGISHGAFVLEDTHDHDEGEIAFMILNNNKTILWNQVGGNNSAGLWGNGMIVGKNTIAYNNFSGNMSLASQCVQWYELFGFAPRIVCDSTDGADQVVTGDSHVWNDFYIGDETDYSSFQLWGSFDADLDGADAGFYNGSIHDQIPVTYTTGFELGDEFTALEASFQGSISPFVNEDVSPFIWFTTSSEYCSVSPCAEASGTSGSSDIIMAANLSTTNVNNTQLNFVYSMFNLIGSDSFSVETNNFTGTGWEIQLTDSGTETTISEQITLGSDYWNLSNIGVRFICDASNIGRDCYVDTVNINGSFMLNTTASVSGFDSEICFSDGTRDTEGDCNRGIRYDAETDTTFFAGTINATGTIVGGISGSGTLDNWAIFTASAAIGNAPASSNATDIIFNYNTHIDEDLYVAGDVAIGTTDLTASLVVIDSILQDIESAPILEGSLTDAVNINGARGIYIFGTYAYVASLNSDSLTIFDISDPSNPMLVGTLIDAVNMDGATDVYVIGDYAYVTGLNSYSLAVVDISNASSPTLAGSLIDAVNLDGAYGLHVYGRYAYVASSVSSSLSVIDISDPTNPTLEGALIDFTNLDSARDVYVVGEYAYVTGFSSDNLAVVDISDPSTPVIAGSLIDSTNMDGAYRVYVSGRYAYVTGLNSDSLAIIDISNPSVPTLEGSLIDNGNLNGASGVQVSRDYAYIGSLNGDSLTIVDISNASLPVYLSKLVDFTNLDGLFGVFLSGRYAYVTGQNADSISAVDINGVQFTSASIGNIETDSLLVSNNAIIGGDLYSDSFGVGFGGIKSDGPLSILGLGYFLDNVGIGTSNPSEKLEVVGVGDTKIVINSSDGSNAALRLVDGTEGDWTFQTTSGDLRIYDVAGGANEVVRFQKTTGNVGIGTSNPNYLLEVNGNVNLNNTLYVNQSSGNVGIGTASPNNSLNIIGDLNVTENITGTYYFGDGSQLTNVVGVSIWTDVDGNATFTTGNVGIGTTTPTAPLSVIDSIMQEVESAPTLDGVLIDGTNLNGIRGVYVDDKYAYVVSRLSDSFSILDISDPANPTLISSFVNTTYMDEASAVIVSGSYAYVTGLGSASLAVVDISDPSSPVIAGGLIDVANLDGAYGLHVSGRYAYVAASASATFAVVDISDPTTPTLAGSIGNITYFDGIRDIYVVGDYAYAVSFTSDNLVVVDISDPTTPAIVGNLVDGTNMDGAYRIYVSGRYAYVTGLNSDSLAIVDISDPTTPVLAGSLIDGTNLNGPGGIVVSGNYAYISALNSDRLTLIDISNASNPVYLTSLFDPTNINGAFDIFLQGRYAYVTGQQGDSFSVIDINGVQFSSASIGNVKINILSVTEDAVVGGDLYSNSLSVGASGIESQGALSISDTVNSNYFGGWVGIGTNDPEHPLHVFTNPANGQVANFGRPSTSGTWVEINNSEGEFGLGTDGGEFYIYDRVDTAYRMVINTLGYIGVGGKTVPTSPLHVYENTANTDSSAGLTVENAGTGDAITQFLITGATRYVMGIDNSDSNKFKIAYSADLASNAAFTIDGSGQVGISRTSPSESLDVTGNIRSSAGIFNYHWSFTYDPLAVSTIWTQYIGTYDIDDGVVDIVINDVGNSHGASTYFRVSRRFGQTPRIMSMSTGNYELHWRSISANEYELFFVDNQNSNNNDIDYDVYINIQEGLVTTTLSSETDTNILEVTYGLTQDQNAYVGIGARDPVLNLHVNKSSEGNTVRIQDTDGTCDLDPDSGSLVTTCSSDVSLKENVVDASSALDYFSGIVVKDYTVISSGNVATGVVAQEINITHPELVHDSNGTLMVEQPNPWKLLKALQELEAENNAMKVSLCSLGATEWCK